MTRILLLILVFGVLSLSPARADFLDTPWLDKEKQSVVSPSTTTQPAKTPPGEDRFTEAIGRGLAGGVLIAIVIVVISVGRRVWLKLRHTGKAIAPSIRSAALVAGSAGISAVQSASRSNLERKLDELDKLFAEGKISAEERETARTAVLLKL